MIFPKGQYFPELIERRFRLAQGSYYRERFLLGLSTFEIRLTFSEPMPITNHWPHTSTRAMLLLGARLRMPRSLMDAGLLPVSGPSSGAS